ncbi:MAG: hypothetical protein V4635_14075 [Bacteroidota bacterium]
MKLFLLSFVNLLLLISCKKYKPAEAAFFLKPSNTTVAPINNNTIQQGTASNKITDLFLYVNGKFQGVYPVGNLMPIINKNQNVTIDVFPGIKNNGINGTRVPYPFLDHLSFDTLVESGKTIERTFAFKYGPGVNFDLMENFELSNNGYKIKRSPGSAVDYTFASPGDSFEGRSLQVALTSTADIGQVESTIAYSLPAGSSNVYLELNYKCSGYLIVGLIGDISEKEAFILNPQDSWNKTYIQLSNAVSNTPVSDAYKLYFKIVNTSENPDPKFFLDNIKLLHL